MAAKVGHDLVIDVERWSASLTLTPGGESRLTASVDAGALRAREGHGGVKPLSDGDRADINRNIVEKVLHSARNPEITFESDPFVAGDAAAWHIPGRLTLHGASVPVALQVTVERSQDAITLNASAQVTQSNFGIKPYTAMMGALKVADDVEVRVQARVPARDWPA